MACSIRSLLLFAAIVFVAPRPVHAISINTVPVGNLGNANDPSTGSAFGGVDYFYNIGMTEVTVGQYTAFLNAVAKTDTYRLWRTSMATDANVAGINRNGVSGSYTYSVIGSPDKPITYVGWGDAVRFSNWLHNGQPSGAQNGSTTEAGAYTLNGAMTNDALMNVTRNAGATWFLPSEREWYKAAYHQPAGQGGDADNYWAFPTSTNSMPYSAPPPGTAAPTQSNTGNFLLNDSTTNGYNDGYAVTSSTTRSNSQNYLTDVGAYVSSRSPYGTFDQEGNVIEWNESVVVVSTFPFRGLRGSSWAGSVSPTPIRGHAQPDLEFSYYGFRVATFGNRSVVTNTGTPISVDLGGGASDVGGVAIDFTASSAGTLQATYNAVNLSQLPPTPAFANFWLTVPGSSVQYWDLQYTGTFTGQASLTFAFDPNLVTPNSAVGIWHFNPELGWEFLGGTIEGHTITVNTTSFSPFALAEAPRSGDFNKDDVIDAADYVTWRKIGDAVGSYADWRNQFGQEAGVGNATSIPEPSVVMSLAFGVSIICIFANVSSFRLRSGAL